MLSDAATLRPIRDRDRALRDLATVVHAEWGERCDGFEAGCACRMAWAVFDLLKKMTEGSSLDDPSEMARLRAEGALAEQEAGASRPQRV